MNFSIPDFSTPDFSTPNLGLKNPGLKSSWLKNLGLKSPGLKCHLSRRLKDISTLDFSAPDFSTMNFSIPWFKNSCLKSPGLKSSWLKSLGLNGAGLKLGVEKSGVEISFNRLFRGNMVVTKLSTSNSKQNLTPILLLCASWKIWFHTRARSWDFGLRASLTGFYAPSSTRYTMDNIVNFVQNQTTPWFTLLLVLRPC